MAQKRRKSQASPEDGRESMHYFKKWFIKGKNQALGLFFPYARTGR